MLTYLQTSKLFQAIGSSADIGMFKVLGHPELKKKSIFATDIDSKCLIFPDDRDFLDPLPKEIREAQNRGAAAREYFKGRCTATWMIQSIHLPCDYSPRRPDDYD